MTKQPQNVENRAAGTSGIAGAPETEITPYWRRGYAIRPGTEAVADVLYRYLDAWENHNKCP